MLTKNQLRYLKSEAHHLNPIVLLGNNGLTDNVHKEIDLALTHHELIKVKLGKISEKFKEHFIAEITDKEHCELVQKIGNTATFYRNNPKINKYTLPKD